MTTPPRPAHVRGMTIGWLLTISLGCAATSAEWTEPTTGMRFVRVPAGRFVMGSPASEPERAVQERQHVVRLTRSLDQDCPYPRHGVVNPVAQCSSPRKIIRGGSWYFGADSARCAGRYTHRPQDLGPSLGFRVVREAR